MYLVADMACVLCLSCLRLLFWFKLLLYKFLLCLRPNTRFTSVNVRVDF